MCGDDKAPGTDWFNGDVDCDGNELVTLRADLVAEAVEHVRCASFCKSKGRDEDCDCGAVDYLRRLLPEKGHATPIADYLAGPHEWGYRDLADGAFVEDRKPFEAAETIAELLEALQEAHRALMHYEWYANPASGWAAPDKKFVRHMTDAAIAKATGAA